MKNITISDEAYNEFVDFLKDNTVESYNVRINLAGYGCSGAVFNISISEVRDGDVSEQVKDITFIAEQKLIDEFGGFIILSSEENNGMGLSLKPVIPGESGCGSCGGGCH